MISVEGDPGVNQVELREIHDFFLEK